jgi:hypothetical protein
MPKPQKRDNDYYLERLEREHPTIHADYLAGKFPSALKAFEAAGLKGRRTRLQELKNAWQKSTPGEQRDFLAWLGVGAPAPSTPVSGPPMAINGRLEAWAVARIGHIMASRRMKMGQVLDELRFDRRNPALGLALNQGSVIRDRMMLDALEKWLTANASV